jgi:hypothetical protein
MKAFLKNKNLLSFLFLLLFLILFKSIKSQINTGNTFSIITPLSISEEIEKINLSKNSEIPYRIGKFGDVPFGKTVLGMIFIQQQYDGSNYWCNYDETSTPLEIEKYSSIYKAYLPIILVDQGQCSYSKKALNVQLRGGSAMLIVDDDNNLDNNDKFNILDLRGNSIKIPSLIIPRNYGDIIKNYIYEQKNLKEKEPVIVSIKFSAYNPDGSIELNLFMSSDDINAIYFFKEFEKYKELIGDKLKFNPIYKYHNYKGFKAENDIKSNSESPCFSKKNINFCSTKNSDLKINNPRLVLMENLRQSCIFINHGVDLYWNYMIEFGNQCTNFKNPIFNEECSKISFYRLRLNDKDYDKIISCMQDLIDFNSKVDDDYELYNYRKVYEYPLITLNGIKFTGMFLPRMIFNSICTSFINDDIICGSPLVKALTKNTKLYPPSLIFFIITFLFFMTIILVICYRRVAYRSIEQTLIEKIQTETIKSIGKHQQKKEKKELVKEIN